MFYGISARKSYDDYVYRFVPTVISKSFIFTLCALTKTSIATSQDEHTSVQRGPGSVSVSWTWRLSLRELLHLALSRLQAVGFTRARADLMHWREPCQKGITHDSQAEGRKRGQL